MVYVLAGRWWAVLLRGLVALLFGILTFVWPVISLTALVFLFGAYALANGLFTVVAAFEAPQSYRHWWALLLEGVFGVAAGVLIPTANALIANATAPERRGAVFGVMAAAASIGAFIGPLAGSGLAAAFGFRSAFLASAALLLAMAGAVAVSFHAGRALAATDERARGAPEG